MNVRQAQQLQYLFNLGLVSQEKFMRRFDSLLRPIEDRWRMEVAPAEVPWE